MAALCYPSLSFSFATTTTTRSTSRRRISVAMAKRWVEFPYAAPPLRSLLDKMASDIDQALDLQPSTTPADVASFQSQKTGAQGSLILRAGSNSSQVKFALASWLHCSLPGGSASIDITTLLVNLASTTRVPHFLLEFIQSSPTSGIMVLDLLPRKDVVDDPDYLDLFYQRSQLDKLRQEMHNWKGSEPYISPVLYVRAVCSPTAMLYKLNFDTNDDFVWTTISKVFSIWLETYRNGAQLGAQVDEETERRALEHRDLQIKSKAIEIDLQANLPKLFDQEIADRVIAAYREFD